MNKFIAIIFTLFFSIISYDTYAQKANVSIRENPNRNTYDSETGKGRDSGREYVNLGLPSGTLWATCNVGAKQPYELGDYFAWGEICGQKCGKEIFDWSTYDYDYGDHETMFKYNISKGNKLCDNKSTLEELNDMACRNWTYNWCTPTNDQFKELINECYWVWADAYKGFEVSGYIVYKVKSENDKRKFVHSGETPSDEYNVEKDVHIFFPLAGGFNKDKYLSNIGGYWTSQLYSTLKAHILGLRSNTVEIFSEVRCVGLSVRPVVKQKKQ